MQRDAKARERYADAVEYLCRHVEPLRDVIGPARWDGPFTVVRDGDPATAAWRDAVRELHDAAEAAGIPNGLGLHSLMGGFPVGPTPRSVGWVCPTGRCARVELREDDAENSPRCALSGRPMRLLD